MSEAELRNDVCLRQMMSAAPNDAAALMMCASHMGKHYIIVSETNNIISTEGAASLITE